MQKTSAVNVKWTSRFEFVVALLGYSIGLPEFWRVPFLTYRNGGGSFIIVYIFLMLVCGLPLYFLELALSQFSGKGPWKFWDICPLLRGIGIATAVINCITAVNAATLVAWTFEYFVNSFKGVLPWTNCDNDWNTPTCYREGSNKEPRNMSSYNITGDNIMTNLTSWMGTPEQNSTIYHPVDSVDEFWMYRALRISDGIDCLGSIGLVFVVYLFVMRLLAALSIAKSVQSMGKVFKSLSPITNTSKTTAEPAPSSETPVDYVVFLSPSPVGIPLTSARFDDMLYVTALLPGVLVLVIWIRAVTLPGATKGMLYFVSADFRRLADPQLWIEAAFQTFLTLGPGWGGLMMIGGHSKFRTNCIQSSVISKSATLTFGLLNGLVVFSVLGVMSEEIGGPINDVIGSAAQTSCPTHNTMGSGK